MTAGEPRKERKHSGTDSVKPGPLCFGMRKTLRPQAA